MNMRCLVQAVVLASSFCSSATAEDVPDPPDVIACLKAVDPLATGYRDWMQMQCLSGAGEICLAPIYGEETCIPDLLAAMRRYCTLSLSTLPETLEGKSFQAKGYPRRLTGVAARCEKPSASGDPLTTSQLLSDYVETGVALTTLFWLAQSAEVTLP